MKPIKSTDPRKKAIMAALKVKSGGNKVTNVKETEFVNTYYEGDCMSGGRSGYRKLGRFRVSMEEVESFSQGKI